MQAQVRVGKLYMAISTDFQYRHRRNAPEADPELDLLGPLRRFLGGHKHMKTWHGHGFNMIWRPNFNNPEWRSR
jgi:hypothetical protein